MSPAIHERDLRLAVERFGPGDWHLVRAPGRVNLIGEHTDYHEGFVLPAAIDRYVRILGKRRDDRTVVVHSGTFAAEHRFDLDAAFSADAGWARRAEGIIRTVLAEGPSAGMDLWMETDLPIGGGLSSSAASMAGLGVMASALADRDLDRRALARTCQHCEHEFADVRCGIMDQLAVLLGEAGHALFVDCRSLETEGVRIPDDQAIIIVDSGVRHELASSGYNTRVAECAGALTKLREVEPGLRTLRDLTDEILEAAGDRLDALERARCRHVVGENRRVCDTVQALRRRDASAIGRLFAASHASLRDDYEVSCPELDALVEAVADAPGKVASRMTGGGFGGCTVNLVERAHAEAFIAHVTARVPGASGIAVVAAAGVSVERLSA